MPSLKFFRKRFFLDAGDGIADEGVFATDDDSEGVLRFSNTEGICVNAMLGGSSLGALLALDVGTTEKQTILELMN